MDIKIFLNDLKDFCKKTLFFKRYSLFLFGKSIYPYNEIFMDYVSKKFI